MVVWGFGRFWLFFLFSSFFKGVREILALGVERGSVEYLEVLVFSVG